MSIRNRELSQFGSFIYIEDSTKNIGIATTATPFVGIGTTNPQKKLHVVGDIQLDGDLFYQGQLSFGNVDIQTTGIITATAFYNSLGQQLVAFDSWTGNGNNIYRLNGSVGVGTTNPIQKLDVIGNVRSGQFISTATGTRISGTPPLSVDSQTLVTNLNADYLRGGIAGGSASGDIVTVDANQNLTNKTFNSGVQIGDTLLQSSSGIHTISLPAQSGTLLTEASLSGVISGVVTTGNIQNGTIINEDIADGTIQNIKLVNNTISGVSLGSSLGILSFSGLYWNGGTSYRGSSNVTVSLAATHTNLGNNIVARNASGDFSAATVTVTNLNASGSVSAGIFNITNLTAVNSNITGITTVTAFNATNGNFSGIITASSGSFIGTVTASNFNSTSDLSLKTNVHTVENALQTLENIRGVSFEWKESHQPSFGVIAQELEQILPELVNDGIVKSVNYNGIIGVLIEAVKELSEEVKELKKIINT